MMERKNARPNAKRGEVMGKQNGGVWDEPLRSGDLPWEITREMVENSPYQLMPAPTPEEFAGLEQQVAEEGVTDPIFFDENGNPLDGHNRLLICLNRGITDFPCVIRHGMSEQETRDWVRRRHCGRRHLTRAQKRRLCQDQLRETPERSDRQIGEIMGLDHHTVGQVRAELEERGEIAAAPTREGKDGRTRPAARSVPQIPPHGSVLCIGTSLCGEPYGLDHGIPIPDDTFHCGGVPRMPTEEEIRAAELRAQARNQKAATSRAEAPGNAPEGDGSRTTKPQTRRSQPDQPPADADAFAQKRDEMISAISEFELACNALEKTIGKPNQEQRGALTALCTAKAVLIDSACDILILGLGEDE